MPITGNPLVELLKQLLSEVKGLRRDLKKK